MHEWMCRYGATGSGKLVDAAGLQLLQNMGFQRALAAEALKQVSSWSISPLLHLAYFSNLEGFQHALAAEALKQV